MTSGAEDVGTDAAGPGLDAVDRMQGRLFAIAYQLTGSVTDAEDILQEVRQALLTSDRSSIRDINGWLVTVTANRSLDRLRAAARRREQYVGPWLPEPLITDPAPDPGDQAALADEVSYALLVVLDELSPPERVAFVLHDVFGEPFDRIAALLDRTPQATRQLASRARRRVRDHDRPRDADPRQRWEVATRFRAAVEAGDLDAVVALLAPEVTLTSDGGGIAPAARQVVTGADRVARFFLGLARKAGGEGAARPVLVNGDPGMLLYLGEQLVGVLELDVHAGHITAVRAVVNPDKLRHLGV